MFVVRKKGVDLFKGKSIHCEGRTVRLEGFGNKYVEDEKRKVVDKGSLERKKISNGCSLIL